MLGVGHTGSLESLAELHECNIHSSLVLIVGGGV